MQYDKLTQAITDTRAKTPEEALAALTAKTESPSDVPEPDHDAKISKAQKLGLGRVRLGDVQRAMGIETMAIKKARRVKEARDVK